MMEEEELGEKCIPRRNFARAIVSPELADSPSALITPSSTPDIEEDDRDSLSQQELLSRATPFIALPSTQYVPIKEHSLQLF